MEILDIYDENRCLTGRTRIRGEAAVKGEYSLVVLVWIINGRGEILITLRSPEKESFPGYWENTGGAVQSGESSLQGCIRELYEETGIAAEPQELTLINSHRGQFAFYDAYAIKKDIAAEDIRLQPGETAAARWVTPERFEEMCEQGLIAQPITAGYRRVKDKLLEYINSSLDSFPIEKN